jgi:hypothetical protein
MDPIEAECRIVIIRDRGDFGWEETNQWAQDVKFDRRISSGAL